MFPRLWLAYYKLFRHFKSLISNNSYRAIYKALRTFKLPKGDITINKLS